MSERADSDATRIAFVCVRNAGRSQMAHAFAGRELAKRGLRERIELTTGGTKPADNVHEGVVRAMDAVGIDISDRTPREVAFREIQESDYVVTMGCSADGICPAGWAGETRDWDLDDPGGASLREVEEIRDEIERRVIELVDELASAR